MHKLTAEPAASAGKTPKIPTDGRHSWASIGPYGGIEHGKQGLGEPFASFTRTY